MTTSALADARFTLASPLLADSKPAEPGGNGVRSQAWIADWDRVHVELARLRGLDRDWDGHGALPLDPANADQAIAWIKEMRRWRRAMPPTQILPGTLGEVILEWRLDGFHLIAEISTPERLEWMLDLPGQPAKQWETDSRGPWIVSAEN